MIEANSFLTTLSASQSDSTCFNVNNDGCYRVGEQVITENHVLRSARSVLQRIASFSTNFQVYIQLRSCEGLLKTSESYEWRSEDQGKLMFEIRFVFLTENFFVKRIYCVNQSFDDDLDTMYQRQIHVTKAVTLLYNLEHIFKDFQVFWRSKSHKDRINNRWNHSSGLFFASRSMRRRAEKHETYLGWIRVVLTTFWILIAFFRSSTSTSPSPH